MTDLTPEDAFIAWLVDTLHYPFDCSFPASPPPVDHGRLADYWSVTDGWDIPAHEARATVFDEAGLCSCGCSRAVHIGEIGCPCGLPDDAHCSLYLRDAVGGDS